MSHSVYRQNNYNDSASTHPNGKRKVFEYIENSSSKNLIKIREWDLPKLRKLSNHEKNAEQQIKLNTERKKDIIKPNKKECSDNSLKLPVIKTIDDLFKKTEAKPPIYWTPKEVFLSQNHLIQATVSDIVNSIVNLIEAEKEHADNEFNNLSYRYQNPKQINLSHWFPTNSQQPAVNSFDNGSLFLVYYNQEIKKLVCSIYSQSKVDLELIKSIEIPANRSVSDLKVHMHKFNNLIYLAYNIHNGSLIQVIDQELNIKEEINFIQHISRILGLNDSFIYFKPEIENHKFESRIYIYDRKLVTKKVIGQCVFPLRPFYFCKSLLQLENLDGKYLCLNSSDDTFRIISEQNGIVLYSIRIDSATNFLISSNSQQIIIYSKQHITYFSIDGILLDHFKLKESLITDTDALFFNDKNDNLYLFDKNKHLLIKY